MEDLQLILSQFSLTSAIDIFLVAVIFYVILRFFAGTQAVQLIRGILVIVLIGALASTFTDLKAFTWLIRSGGVAILIAIPVIFQPEIRRALERVGRTGVLLARTRRSTGTSKLISDLISTCSRLSQLRNGAIIILEDQTGLEDYVESGVRINASINTELLLSIFNPTAPLHDGAVVIRDEQIVAASVVLPLTQRTLVDTSLGTRHRAAIGITEDSDALSLVVSEETGNISAARNGRLTRRLDERRLRRILERFYESRGQLFDIDVEGADDSE
ncbi:MAG: TIGR00159 family protein [Chloroflexi bacterium]|nr:TIGR00159 family protein [Chloroflexota bacterium]